MSEPVGQTATVTVRAPSRLHFGMTAFGHPGTRQFGGAGVAINQPGLVVRFSAARHFEVVGSLARRTSRIIQLYAERAGLGRLPGCRIEIVSAPPEHVGLGTGTQLSLALVAGLNAFQQRELLSPKELADLTGRAARSAVGTYAFTHGGLILDAGHLDGETLAPLERRVELPHDWRFVLVCRRETRGVFGDEETHAFRDLEPVEPRRSRSLWAELRNELFPAAERGDFERFGESLYRFGHEAGLCFAKKQGGPFAGEHVAEIVSAIRALGVRGVGQTSWGPTVFAAVKNARAADRLVAELRPRLDAQHEIVVAEPNNSGAQISRESGP